VVGVLDVLHVELPVVRQHLREAAEHDWRAPGQDPADAVQDLLAEVLLDVGQVVVQGAEDEPVHDCQSQLARPVSLQAEVGWHAALAAHSLGERDRGQVALQAVGPGVVDAGEVAGVAVVGHRDQRAAVRAAVLERVDLPVGVPGDQDRLLADERGTEVTRLG
jgi:hypothetical protein